MGTLRPLAVYARPTRVQAPSPLGAPAGPSRRKATTSGDATDGA